MRIVDTLLFLLFVAFVITQTVLPLIFQTPLFPLFRRRKTQAELLRDLAETRQTLAEDQLQQELCSLHAQHDKNVKQYSEQPSEEPKKSDQQ